MKRWICLVLVSLAAGVAVVGACELALRAPTWMAPAPVTMLPTPPSAANMPGLMVTLCSGCHNSGRSKIDLDPELVTRVRRRDRATWEKVLEMLRAHEMPPKGQPQPTSEERDCLIAWVDERLAATSQEPAHFGRYLVRRLHRTEYVNAVRDLVGVRFHPADGFPADDGDWDYSKEVPSLPPQLRDQYLAAADTILGEAASQRSQEMNLLADDDDSFEDAEIHESESQHQAALHPPTPDTEADCARAILTALARRAYRRPPTAGEVDELCSVFDDAANEGMSFAESIDSALKVILTSPRFLYVTEVLPDGARGDEMGDPFALASRLALFLWNSVPDEELLEQAELGVLNQHLPEQVRRMLKHPRARHFAADFAEYWLELRKLADATEVDAALIAAMRQETIQFVQHIVGEDRNVLEFLDTDYTFLNERLARHYGIAGVHGEEMRRVSTAGTARGGLPSQASLLTITSQGGQTSVVQRGKWILANLLDSPPPAPPAGLLEGFEQTRKAFKPGTEREHLAAHREHHSCAHCHAKLDGLGLALENFDAVGRWRSEDSHRPIDAAVKLPTGESFDGPVQFKAYLRGQKELFVRCLSGKLLSYALDRGLGDTDRAALTLIPERVRATEFRFSSLVVEVVRSEPFLIGWDARER